jgi:hypothetical protein
MYEELMSEKEASESLEFDEMFAIMPGHKQGILKSSKYKRAEIKSYSSSEYECMSKDAIRNYVFSNGLI